MRTHKQSLEPIEWICNADIEKFHHKQWCSIEGNERTTAFFHSELSIKKNHFVTIMKLIYTLCFIDIFFSFFFARVRRVCVYAMHECEYSFKKSVSKKLLFMSSCWVLSILSNLLREKENRREVLIFGL